MYCRQVQSDHSHLRIADCIQLDLTGRELHPRTYTRHCNVTSSIGADSLFQQQEKLEKLGMKCYKWTIDHLIVHSRLHICCVTFCQEFACDNISLLRQVFTKWNVPGTYVIVFSDLKLSIDSKLVYNILYSSIVHT
jgi:hypothetical protein